MRFRAHVRWTGDDPYRPEDLFVAVDATDGDAAALAAHAQVQAERKGGRTLVYAVTPLSVLEGEEAAPAPEPSSKKSRPKPAAASKGKGKKRSLR